MRRYRGHRWTCGRLEVTRWLDFEWDLEQVPLPRVKFWPDERGMLVGLSLGDRHSDPIAGADVRVDGRVGQAWSTWLWTRRHRRGR